MRLAAIAFPAIDPIAFRVGPFAVRWYGIAYLLGFLGAYLVMRWLVRRWSINISDDDQLTIILAAVVGVVVGGRLGYVLFYGDGYYWSHPAQMLALWDGGMSFHGGLAGILIAAGFVALTMRIPWLTLCDIGCGGRADRDLLRPYRQLREPGTVGQSHDRCPWGVVFPSAGRVAASSFTALRGASRGRRALPGDGRAGCSAGPAPSRRALRRAAGALRRLQDRGGVRARARRPDRSTCRAG